MAKKKETMPMKHKEEKKEMKKEGKKEMKKGCCG